MIDRPFWDIRPQMEYWKERYEMKTPSAEELNRIRLQAKTDNVCIDCRDRPFTNKKRRLCDACYRRNWHAENKKA